MVFGELKHLIIVPFDAYILMVRDIRGRQIVISVFFFIVTSILSYVNYDYHLLFICCMLINWKPACIFVSQVIIERQFNECL